MSSIFNKKIYNSDKFRAPAISWLETGVYCSAPRGTLEYREYWDEQTDRCLNGWTAPDGDWISGYNYFYLNFCPIEQTVIKRVTTRSGDVIDRKERTVTFPVFYDYDYYFFIAVEDAEIAQKHLCVLKSRRKGYSYKCGSMMCRNFYLIPNSKSYAYASDTQYLDKDGILTKAWSYMDHIDEHTAWGKKRDVIDRAFHKRASFRIKNALGNTSEQGYKSEIIGASIANNPDKVRGKAGKLILFEESGKCEKPGTRIIMADGSVKVIEDICVGDDVMGPDGKPRKVLATTYGIDHMYDIIPNNGDIHTVNSKHLIYHKRHDWNGSNNLDTITAPEYIEMIEKHPRHAEYYSLLKTDKVEFKAQDVIIDPYTFGLWLGDGTSTESHITSIDEPIINYLHDYAKHNDLCVYDKLHKNSNAKCVSFSGGTNGNWFLNELRVLNVYNNKHIPTCYKINSKDNLRLLLAGVIDTDGYYDKRKNMYEIVQKRECIIDDLMFIARSLGIVCTKTTKIVNGVTYYRLFLRYNLTQIPVILERKKARKNSDFLRDPLSTRFTVKYNGIGEYYGIQISGDNLYVHDDFTIVHNCPELEAAWTIAQPSVETDGKAWGLMIAFGTGGSEDSDFGTLRRMFYEPEAFNMLSFENIWDEGSPTERCGFFVPQWANMMDVDDNGTRLYMDKDGNTLHKAALKRIEELRKPIIENSTSTSQIDRYVAENCITPQEACLEVSGNIFPKKDLQEHLSRIRVNKSLQSHKQVGDLVFNDNARLEWVVKPHGDLLKFKLSKEDDRAGAIVIWEHPPANAPHGLYIAGCLTPGEKVMTDRGLISVEDVTLNDRLINEDGKLVPINTLLRYDKENEDVYEVKMSNTYRTTTFTQEHPLLTSEVRRNCNGTINEDAFDYSYNRMRNVSVGDYIRVPNIYKNSSLDHFVADTPVLADSFWWYVGYWLGDGWVDSNGNIMVCGDINDAQIISNIKTAMSEFGVKYTERYRNSTFEIGFKMDKFSKWLIKHFGKYAHGKFVSETVKRMPNADKAELLKGYLDSDGCVYTDSRNYNSVEFVSVSLDLLEAVQDMFFGLGIVGNLTKLRDSGESNIEGRSVLQKKCYHLRFGHNDSIIMKNLLNCKTQSKKVDSIETWLSTRSRPKSGCFISKCGNYIHIKITEIKQSKYTGIVYNFDCETHTFMCHHITTHNCDPYDHDSSSTDSLGSVFIFKRFQSFEEYYDLPVAEYTGRPNEGSDEFYERVRRLLIYYNATLLYENQNKGLFAYFRNKNCDYLLADQPDIIHDIVANSTVSRSKGIHMSEPIKDWGETLIRDWLLEEYAPGRPNLTKILSEPLLEELIAFNRKRGNYDRVMAFMTALIYRVQLHTLHVKASTEVKKEQRFLDFNIFKDYDE